MEHTMDQSMTKEEKIAGVHRRDSPGNCRGCCTWLTRPKSSEVRWQRLARANRNVARLRSTLASASNAIRGVL